MAVEVEGRRHGGRAGAMSVGELVDLGGERRPPRHSRHREPINRPEAARQPTAPSAARDEGRTLVVRRVRTVGLLGRPGPSWFRLTFAGNRAAASVRKQFQMGSAWLVTGALGLFALAVVLLSMTVGSGHRDPVGIAVNQRSLIPAEPAAAAPALPQADDTPVVTAPSSAGSPARQSADPEPGPRASRGSVRRVHGDAHAGAASEASRWSNYAQSMMRPFLP